MKVAFLSFDFGEYCVPIANALAWEGAEVSLFLAERELRPVADDVDEAVRLVPFEKPRLREPLRQLRMCLGLVREIKRTDPDVVHVQQGHLWFDLFLPALRRYPVVLTVHDYRHHVGDRGARKTPQAVANFAFRSADRLIVHAEELKRGVAEMLSLAEDRIHVIPHVVVGDRIAPAAEHERAANNTILFFGRIWPYKGLDYLIRAEPLVSAAVPDVRIVIAGEGEDFGRYRLLMANPDRFVVHNEFVSNERRAELFAEASVVVLPYIEASQSGVVPVAYSFSKPVVATRVGGLPEIVEDGETGYVVPPRDERALAEAIVRLLRDPALRRRLGTNGKRKLERECSPKRVAEQTLAVYELVVRESAFRPRRRTRPLATTPDRRWTRTSAQP